MTDADGMGLEGAHLHLFCSVRVHRLPLLPAAVIILRLSAPDPVSESASWSWAPSSSSTTMLYEKGVGLKADSYGALGD